MRKKMNRRWLALLLAIAMMFSVVNLVSYVEASTPDLTGMTTFVFDGDSVTVKEGSDTNYEVVVYDSTDTESEAVVTTDESGNSVYAVPEGSAGQLYVAVKKKGGSYVFEGKGNGAIVVKKEATADAVLYFNGLDLTSAFTTPVAVNKDSAATCTFHIVEGTTNTLTDNAYNNEENNADNLTAEDAVMKFKAGSNVFFEGSGTLNVNGNAKNGIKANNALTINGDITFNINVVDNGISCENALVINSGTFNVVSTGGDGIKSSSDDGQIGDVTIVTGTFNINVADDAIHADLNLTLGQEGADNSDLVVNVENCVEGLEGATVNIYSGTYKVFASDDSINAANSDLTGHTYEINIYDGNIYAASTTGDCVDSNTNITVYGGTLIALGAINPGEANAALDCDGTLSILGGTVLAIGKNEMAQTPRSGQNYVTWTAAGASTAVAAGGTGNNRPGGNRPGGNRPGMGGSSLAIQNNEQVTIYDADGNALFSTIATWLYEGTSTANHVLYSAGNITAGSSYTIEITTPETPVESETPDESDGPVESETPDESDAPVPPSDMPAPPSDMPVPPSDMPAPPSDMPMGFYYGDVDTDHGIEAEDALLILKHVVQLELITDGLALELADVDHDGEISASDALCTLQVCVKLRETEVYEPVFN